MKLILHFPNDTKCAFINFVRGDIYGMSMQSHAIEGDEFVDGAEITILPQDIKYGEK